MVMEVSVSAPKGTPCTEGYTVGGFRSKGFYTSVTGTTLW